LKLADAQHVVAVERGARSWPDLVARAGERGPGRSAAPRAWDARAAEATELGAAGLLAPLRAAYRYATAGWLGDEPHEAGPDAGAWYLPGEPVRVRISRRGIRYGIDDLGAARRLAGAPPGWRELAEEIVRPTGLNVSRGGAVGVGVVHGRDIPALALRIADASLQLHRALLDAQA